MSNVSVISVDIGTSEIKAILVDETGIIDHFQIPCSLEYGKPGWVEQKPDELAKGILRGIRALVDNNSDRITEDTALVFTSQMQGILPVDSEGKPLMNLITWLDTRAAELTKKVIFRGWPKISGIPAGKLVKFLKITGGAPGNDGKNTLAKTLWIKTERPDIYEKTSKFLDTKDYAVLIATGRFVTSVDMAYVTWLMDTREDAMDWSPELCDMFGLDVGKFPEIKKSTDIIGNITDEFASKTNLPKSVRVINGSGDLLTSAIGSGAIEDGRLHANIGTAGWTGCHFSERARDIPHYTGSIASGIPGRYLILSKQETLGGALDWIRRIVFSEKYSDTPTESDIKEQYKRMDILVENSPPGAKKLIFTPWLHGERSPINDPFLRGQLFNIGMYHDRSDIIRAVFESVAYNLRWGIDVVENLSKVESKTITVIGGGSKSDVWCQIFADVWQKDVVRLKQPQMASGLGAACIALVSLGILSDFTGVSKLIDVDQIFKPDETKIPLYSNLFESFKKLYKRNKKVFHELNE